MSMDREVGKVGRRKWIQLCLGTKLWDFAYPKQCLSIVTVKSHLGDF